LNSKAKCFNEKINVRAQRAELYYPEALANQTLCGVVNISNAIIRGCLNRRQLFTMDGKLTRYKKYCKQKKHCDIRFVAGERDGIKISSN
jgi:hypothetical protein